MMLDIEPETPAPLSSGTNDSRSTRGSRDLGWSCHAPAGERVRLRLLACTAARQRAAQDGLFNWVPFETGTMSLAAALMFAASRLPAPHRVILPAYSCPDILAAALYARLQVSFVDLAPSMTCPALRAIAETVRQDSHIVVCVDLFGSSNDLHGLRQECRGSGSLIVHDCAQDIAGPGIAASTDADLVVTSLGRGKPTTLLGGGLARARQPDDFVSFAENSFPMAGWSRSGTVLKSSAYNLGINPVAFGLASRLPFLRFGQARLDQISTINRLPIRWMKYAAEQIAYQRGRLDARRDRTMWLCDNIVATGFQIPADAAATACTLGLNRLPVICRDAQQAQLIATRGYKLGISRMYGKTLPEFLEATSLDQGNSFLYPNAMAFSRNVVTVPTHSRVGQRARRRLIQVFRSAQ